MTQRHAAGSPLSVAAPQNVAGGGVPAESCRRPSAPSDLAPALTTNANGQSYLVLRAPRGARAACARALRAGAADAFGLSRVTLRREAGAWVARTEPVWPGYVLAEPSPALDPDALAAVGALTPAESALVRRLGGPSHVVQASQGRIVAGRLVVDFGPLMGLEPLVTRIDRHRRLAWLEPEPGRRMAVGLEVTSKS